MFESLKNTIVGVVMVVGSFLGLYHEPVPQFAESESLGATVTPIAGATYTLSGGGVSSSATSIVLSSLTLPQNGYPIQDADLSATFYVTLEPGNRSRQEVVSCTTVTQNAAGTATLSGCTRGLSPITPYTASSSLQFAHGGGSQVIFSDPPQLFNQYPAKANDETITGQWTFDTFPVTPDNSAASETVAGVTELATGAEAAATTLSGAVGRLALPTAISTSTYNSGTAANIVPITLGTGFLDQGFMPSTISKALTLSGALSITNASVGITSTTTTLGAFPAYHIGKNIQVFSSTGTTTFSVPSGITKVKVQVVGAGGGGGGNTTAGRGSAGGGGGGYALEYVNVTGTSTIQVFVGSGGAGGAAGGGSGSAGGWSTFGTNGEFLSASGGGGATEPLGPGGSGGVGANGDLNTTGGGGGAGATAGQSGTGGSSYFGGGGPGTETDGQGAAGGAYGGGGAGAYSSGGDQAGGAGAQGVVIVEW